MLISLFSKKYIWYFPLSAIYLELALIFLTKNTPQNPFVLLLFSLSFGLFFALLIHLTPFTKFKKALSLIILFIISFYFVLQFYLFRAFGYFYPPETVLHMSSGVLDSFSDSVFKTALSGIYAVPILMLPPILFIFIPVENKNKSSFKCGVFLLALSVILEGSAIAYVFSVPKLKDEYRESYDFNTAAKRFGLICSTKLNFLYAHTSAENTGEEHFSPITHTPRTTFNAFNINFQSLISQETNDDIKKLHMYYSSVLPSEQNEYTGFFKGKNLIFICAEAFSPYCISEDKTPTLYKLTHNGFVFENYYNPSFAESTSGGEYALLLSQVPKRGSGEVGLSMSLAGENNMRYSLPSLFALNGYSCKGYHNNSYTYYNRNVTHPKMNMSWYGVGGSVVKAGHSALDLGNLLSPGWPRSDKELIEHTFDQFANSDEPFFTYYLTVSGHNNYSFSENTQSRNNSSMYENAPHSEKIKAYLSCQYELEKALALLTEKLEASGQLDETVIVLSNDHYPYGLSSTWAGNGGRDYLSELSGGKSADVFEKERGCLIIYNSSIKEPIKISKPVSAFDVTPTVLNLFGISYDSRFFVGNDALASDKGLIFLSNGSIMTESFKYYSESGKTITLMPIDDTEITAIKQAVKNKIKYSFLARKFDYFGVLSPYI